MIGTVILATCFAVGIGSYIRLKNRRNRDNHNILSFDLPPGPWGLPIFGHLPFFGANPGVTFMKWAKIYGPIFYIKFGSIPTVVLNDAKIIKEAFQLDSFSGRPFLPNFVKSCDMKGLAFIDGPRQAEQRKFVIQAFKKIGLTKSGHEFWAGEEIANFLKGLKCKCKLNLQERNTMEKSEQFTIDNFFRVPVLNSIWVSVMGWRSSEGDPTLNHLTELLDKVADTSSSVVIQMSWFFPWVSNALIFFGKNGAVNSLRAIYDFMDPQIEKSRITYVAGEPRSLAHAYFDQVARTLDCNSSFYKGKEHRFTMGELFSAAVDTTTATLDWLLFYMAKEPGVQQKLRREIDDILGAETNGEHRSPTVSDRSTMPYTDAVIQELFRISSIGPFGIFHRATEDVNFHGYRIPEGTMIIPNLYGIHHDPEVWSEPDSFLPERFLNNNKAITGSSDTPNPAALILPFSSGKRNCIGEGFARDQLFLVTTHFFQKFTVSFPTEKIPTMEPVFGFVLKPLPFELLISERAVSNQS